MSEEIYQAEKSDYQSKIQFIDRIKSEKLSSKLSSVSMQNDLFKQQIQELEMQAELKNIQLDNLKKAQSKHEKEIQTYREKINLIETRKESIINELTAFNKNILNEKERIKKDFTLLKKENSELESNVADLKKTLKLTEKESQYNLKLDLMHIRAKLLSTQQDDNMSLASCGSSRSLRAIMPSQDVKHFSNDPNSSLTSSMIDLSETSEICNDFAIDITHIEKFVQDSDSIIMEKKPLEGVQSCLKSLRQQMSDLQHDVYEQVGTSSSWNYKLGFTCEKCEMRWEIEHQVKDDNKNDDEFLESSITKQMPKCNCKIIEDPTETDEETDYYTEEECDEKPDE